MSDDRARDESGQFVQTRTGDAVLEVMEPLEPYTTGELAGKLDWPRRTTYNVLSKLEKDGSIRKKKPEERRVIWIRTEEEA